MASPFRARAELRRVLLTAHTLLSFRYVLDHYRLLSNDPRLTFALTRGADEHGQGLAPTLRRLGVPLVPWDRAVHMPWDLTLFGTHGGVTYLRRATGRVHIQHGLGGGKLVEGEDFTYGPRWALQGGRPKYDVMLEASRSVRDRALVTCPELAGVIRVVGDMPADRLLAARTARDSYRTALGIRPHQIAVLFGSTWGPHGLLSTMGLRLLERALALPPTYKAMLTLHPHLWLGRQGEVGPLVRQAMGLEGEGLVVCGRDESWVPYLVAADVAVIDHGSLGLYFSLLRRPTVSVPVAAAEVNPRAQIAALRVASPMLSHPDVLEEVLEAAMERYDPRGIASRIGEVVSHRGEAAARTRTVLYELLRLPEPAWPAPRALPEGPPRRVT